MTPPQASLAEAPGPPARVAQACARCGRRLAGPDDGASLVCGGCLTALEQGWGHPALEEELDRLAPPVMVVDRDRRLVAVNTALAALLLRERRGLTGLRIGEAMRCAAARLPRGCGHTRHCAACVIDRTVREAFRTGLERIGVATELVCEAGWFDVHLSARPFRAFVEVVLELVRPAEDPVAPSRAGSCWRPVALVAPAAPPAAEPPGPDLLTLIGLRDLQALQDDFAEAAGVASLIVDPAGRPITQPSRFCRLCQEVVRSRPDGLARCVASDVALGAVNVTGPTVQTCLSAGLLDGGTAICVGDRQVASWLIGQVVDEAADERELLGRAAAIGADEATYAAALAEVPRMPRRRFEAAARALFGFGRALSTAVTHTHRQAGRLAERQRLEAAEQRLRDQLAQAQRLESLGRLAGGVAHDFNNVLTPILAYGQLLLQATSPEDPRRELLLEMAEAAERARELSRQLLALGRPRPAARTRRSVGEVVRGLTRLLGRTLREDVLLETSLPDGGDEALVDAGQLEQVLLNLALNAQDAMPSGGRLRLEVVAPPPPGPGPAEAGWVRLLVRDEGAGMDEATRARVFEPFFTTKVAGQGTGLGLFVVQEIVERHGGEIALHSSPGAGTTVEIRLPSARISGPAPTAAATSLLALPRARPGERVVVVEDDPGVLRCAAELLAHLGYRATPVGSAAACLALLSDGGLACDLLLADLVMPDLTGPELHRRLQERGAPPRVLYMSGHGGRWPGGGPTGGGALLEKPLTLEALALAVRSALDGPAPAASAAGSATTTRSG